MATVPSFASTTMMLSADAAASLRLQGDIVALPRKSLSCTWYNSSNPARFTSGRALDAAGGGFEVGPQKAFRTDGAISIATAST